MLLLLQYCDDGVVALVHCLHIANTTHRSHIIYNNNIYIYTNTHNIKPPDTHDHSYNTQRNVRSCRLLSFIMYILYVHTTHISVSNSKRGENSHFRFTRRSVREVHRQLRRWYFCANGYIFASTYDRRKKNWWPQSRLSQSVGQMCKCCVNIVCDSVIYVCFACVYIVCSEEDTSIHSTRIKYVPYIINLFGG